MSIDVLVGLICAVFGLLIGFLTFNRTRDNDVKNDASELAVIRTTLTTISNGVSNIQVDIKANERRTNELSERVARMDESIKTAHKRIDSLENKGE